MRVYGSIEGGREGGREGRRAREGELKRDTYREKEKLGTLMCISLTLILKNERKTRCGMQPRTDDDDKKERRNIVQGHAQARREELKATKNIYSDLAPFEISRLIIENVYVSVA